MTSQEMLDLNNIVDKLRTDLQQCAQVEQADKALQQALHNLGLQNYLYVYYSNSLPDDTKDILHANYSPSMEAWFKYYHDSGFHRLRGEGRRIQESLEPIIYDVPHMYSITKEPSLKAFYKAAMDHGITTCAIFTLSSAQGGVAALIVYHYHLLKMFEISPALKLVLSQISLHYHHYTSKLLYVTTSETNILTPREKECLQWTAQHKKAEEIATLINRSERTVNFHLSNANKKLGTKSKYEAVAKAIALGIIKAE